jgi:glycosyltransferase involved in cell wall biosynthesis
VAFIPVGANIPEALAPDTAQGKSCNPKTVAIFGVTGGELIARESADIGYAIRQVKSRAGELRLRVLGRNAVEAEPALRHELNGTGVEIETLGLLSPGEIAAALSSADVFLFVRGGISSRRGSAIAAIACGLPVVAYESEETAFPITEAGVLMVRQGDRTALAAELARVLADDGLRRELSERSKAAQRKYFSWEVISESFLRVLADDAR